MLGNQENRNLETNPYTSKPFAWQWEKKHWLLVISVGCLVLWWFGSSLLEVSLVKKVSELLPLIGGMAFAADSIIKLV